MTGSDEHLKPLCLFDLARDKGPHITEEQVKHLRECDGFKRILDVFARQFKKMRNATKDKPEDVA